jgi:hypothetical protein
MSTHAEIEAALPQLSPDEFQRVEVALRRVGQSSGGGGEVIFPGHDDAYPQSLSFIRDTAVQARAMKTFVRAADDLLGTYRTSSAEGPAYHILRRNDEQTVPVRVVESGEDLDYPAQQALNDPEAE